MTDTPTTPTPAQPAPEPPGMDAQVALDFAAAVFEGARKAALLGVTMRAGNLHNLLEDCLFFCEPAVKDYMSVELKRIVEGYYGDTRTAD